MPGFFGAYNGSKLDFSPKKNQNLVYDFIEVEKFSVQRFTINKFMDDKLFFEDSSLVVVIEGVILNKAELFIEYKVNNIKDLFYCLYKKKSELFFEELKGSFSGVLFNKQNQTVRLFTNPIGDKQVFYYNHNNTLLFSSDFWVLMDYLKNNRFPFSLDETGQYSLLTYGFQLEDNTLIKEIKKLKAGNYLNFSATGVETIEYHLFNNSPLEMGSENQIIEKIDELFLKAIDRQLSKNKEYGFQNFAPLSAGLDSRITVFAINRILKKPVYNFSYSQNGYYDDITSKEVAAFLGNHYLFKSLNKGLSLFYLDECMEFTGGNVLNYGPGQVWDFLRILNRDEIGVIHTGMLGDVVVGTFFEDYNTDGSYKIGDGAYSLKLIEKLISRIKTPIYENQEIFHFYNRGFNGANMGSPIIFQELTESHSPFYDVDFLNYCLSLPLSYRWDNNIYKKWIKKKFPKAESFPHNGVKLNGFFEITYKKRKYPVGQFFRLTFNKLKSLAGLNKLNDHHMNPLDFWYNENTNLKNYMDDYFIENISRITSQEIKADCTFLYHNGNSVEKNQVLTLLSFYKRIEK